MTNILFAASSYPRSAQDWQGTFVKRIADALAELPAVKLRVWSPAGPLHELASSALTPGDERFLASLSASGGIAHLLRSNAALGAWRGAELVARLHLACRRNQDWTDVHHVNWLQCALGQAGLRKPALVTVLGSDLALLRIPGMAPAMKLALKHKRVVLCPNAEWMVPALRAALGEACEDIVYVPFGVDEAWYRVERAPTNSPRLWVTVLRATRRKIGALFEWTRDADPAQHQFHLFGPLQEPLEIPPWIHHHGPVTPETLARDWYPKASGLISLSQHDEGRPQVMLDAMACGLPVIASPIPGHLDLIRHGETGLVCATRDEFDQALARASDDAWSRKTAAAALAVIRHTYGSWADCARRYQAIHERLRQEPRTR